MLKLITVLAAVAVAVCSLLSAQVTRIPVNPESDQADDVQILMQAKLSNAQQILEGLVTQDFASIEKAAAGLTRISLNTPHDIKNSDDPTDPQVYEHFRLEFIRLAGQLERHAAEQELEATAYIQQNLTATCIACHDHMQRSR